MDTKHALETYRFAAVAADMAIFTVRENQLMALFIKMKKKPFTGKWALPGGLIGPKESIAVAAGRILFEKTGLKNVYLDQFGAFGDVDRDPFGRVVSVAYIALIPSDALALQTTGEYLDVAWFPIKSVSQLAYDHVDILREAVDALRQRILTSTIVCSLLPAIFTFPELQKLYEIILEKSFDKRNFRKKIASLGVITSTGEKRVGGVRRPALLYQFIHKKPQYIHMI